MTEADVALTDFALTIECAACAVALAGGARTRSSRAFVALFTLSATATLLGGIVHGFASRPDHPAYRVLWPATVLAVIGAAAAMGWSAIALLGWGSKTRGVVLLTTIAFSAFVLAGHDDFLVAIAAYAPASLFLAFAFFTRNVGTGVAGLLLGLAAGALQQAKFTPVPSFSHNAFYHLLQMVAFALLFVAARRIPEER